MFGPVRGRWKDGCRCGLRGWPPDGGAQRVFRERAAVECRAPAAEADVRHLRGGGCRVADRGLGPVCSWSRQGVGMSGVGRCAADRRCRVVGQQGGCRAGVGPVRTVGRGEGRRGLSVPARPAWSRCRSRTGPVASPGRSPCSGVEPLFRRARHRVGADRWERRGSAWTLCSGGAGMESPPFPDGPVASPGRKASHLRAQRPPEGARCPVFGLFLSFSAASRRAGTDAVCKSAVSPLGKSEKVVFLFLLYN